MSDQEHNDVQQIKQDIGEIKTALVCLDDIKTAVCGCKEIGVPGLVSRVDILETWKTKLDLRIATISGSCVVIFFIIDRVFLKAH